METTQDRIDAALGMPPMSEVLWILAQLANRADQAGRDGQVELAQQLVPAPLLPKALQLVSHPPRGGDVRPASGFAENYSDVS